MDFPTIDAGLLRLRVNGRRQDVVSDAPPVVFAADHGETEST